MASFVYTEAKEQLLQGLLDFDAPNDFRILLLMSNTTADTEEDVSFVDEITTLDECDGANYARKSLASDAVSKDTTNNRGEYDAADISWTALGAGTRSNVAMQLIKHVTNDADSIPIGYIDTGGFPFAGNGGDVSVTWNAEGILQAT